MRSLCALVAILVGPLAGAQDDLTTGDHKLGKQVFDRWCIHCHAPGPGYPGTQRLTIDRGADRAIIEQRTDLPDPYIRLVVRQGFREMPSFRLTEISATELDALVGYLTRH